MTCTDIDAKPFGDHNFQPLNRRIDSNFVGSFNTKTIITLSLYCTYCGEIKQIQPEGDSSCQQK